MSVIHCIEVPASKPVRTFGKGPHQRLPRPPLAAPRRALSELVAHFSGGGRPGEAKPVALAVAEEARGRVVAFQAHVSASGARVLGVGVSWLKREAAKVAQDRKGPYCLQRGSTAETPGFSLPPGPFPAVTHALRRRTRSVTLHHHPLQLPLIAALCHPDLCPRHWEAAAAVLGFEVRRDEVRQRTAGATVGV